MTEQKKETKKLIERVLNFILKSKKTQFQAKEFENVEDLVKHGIVKKIDEQTELYEFETDAPLLTNAMYELCEKKVGSFKSDILGAFQQVDEFEEILKKEQGIAKNVIATYSAFLRGLKGYVLLQMEQKGVDVGFFFESLIKNKGKRENQLFLFEDSFFRFLPNSGYAASRIFTLCKLAMENDEAYHVLDFARLLPYIKKDLAQQVYDLSQGDELAETKGFVTNLAVGLYNSGNKELFGHYGKLIHNKPNEAFRFFQVIDKKTRKDLEAIHGIVAADEREENRIRKTDVLCALINHRKATKNLREQSFNLIKSYFECQDDTVAHGVLWSSSYIQNFEEERFHLLMAYLQKTSNFKALTNYFRRFNDPKYMYNLLRQLYYMAWGRTSIHLFQDSIGHFWTVNREASEKQISAMFNPERQLGLLPVEVIMCGYINPLPMDLLQLETMEKQKNAIRCFCAFPHSFDKLLPQLLQLRNSKFPEVKAFLKEQLSRLIVEVYHKMLFESIKGLLDDSAKDKKFLKDMSTALERYDKILTLKDSVNDLNPTQNERDYMQLYYSLEHERRTKLIEDIHNREGSFMSHASKSVIVRGNAWKLAGKEEISPLGSVSTSHWMHRKAVLNPELFELELRNF